jgi:hypothetical protein
VQQITFCTRTALGCCHSQPTCSCSMLKSGHVGSNVSRVSLKCMQFTQACRRSCCFPHSAQTHAGDVTEPTFAMKPRVSMSLLASSTLRLVRSPCRIFMLCRWAMPLATSLTVAKIGVRSGRPCRADLLVRNQPLSMPSCQSNKPLPALVSCHALFDTTK